MKKITIILMMVLTATFGFSQQVVVQDFEATDSFTFAGFEGLGSVAIGTDPASGGTNGSNLQLESVSTGNPWQGAEIVQLIDFMQLTTDKTLSIDVYATQAFTLLGKVEIGGPNSAASQSYTTPNQWQTLTFTFNESLDGTGVADGIYEKLVFFPNWSSSNGGFDDPADFTIYIDNLTSETSTPDPDPEPTVAAPTPPERLPEDVISLYSNQYDNITVTEWSAEWDSADIEDVVIDGNDTKKITFGGFLGVDFAANAFDATNMTYFHMDFWVANPDLSDKVFNPKWSNHLGADGETNAYDYTNILIDSPSGEWISLDIPLADFVPVNGADRSAFAQFLITSNIGGVAYVDNIYLHNQTLSTNQFSQADFTVYPNPTQDVWNIKTTVNISSVKVYNLMGNLVLNQKVDANEAVISSEGLATGVYFVKIENEANYFKTVKVIKN
ncbi:secreted Por secretion system protein C-terminal sorting domain [Psychroflexus gondwanensis ACAM 44]|uniref:Secreted Por secretion system protein C-terminal sorting domain n=1 Tax=Psychroflexus gondwanensis ACAM 44 TaxID=1189619 RepID=N1WXK2_9FLAO|nr:T9SS type A sorting domain-containing protein [Psychroflexus gondwanensis]EMY81922.1 secreted Por secretion system protein C-terminal sorting domain [Psychroflexus gondwanensis ACAM 44]